ncbi:MAG: hypothetical protein HGB11_07745, partial [Chlorobiales bacterium]|nr:hypothetical protein [Chlorobiales bacterium]
LAVSALIIVTHEPLEIFNLSFILTNAAVASIILIYPKLEIAFDFTKLTSKAKWFSRFMSEALGAVWKSIAMTIAATIGVAPFIAYYFGMVSFFGLLANVPVSFMVSLAMYIMIPVFLFNFFSATLAGIYAICANELISLSIKSVIWFSTIPFASINLQPDITIILCYFIMVISFLGFTNKPYRGRLLILMLLALNGLVWKLALTNDDQLPSVAINDIGQGRAIIFRTNSEAVLIDAGVRHSQWARIEKQLKVFYAYPLNSFVQLDTRDSVSLKVPAAVHQHIDDSSLALKTIITYRPSYSTLKIISKKKSLLVSTKFDELNESTFYRADVVLLRLRRFKSGEQKKLEQYLVYSQPKRCVIELSPFVPRREKLEFYRYVRTKPQIDVPARGGQILIM